MLTEILKIIAPGTPLREGLDNILKAKTGALIIIGDSKEVLDKTKEYPIKAILEKPFNEANVKRVVDIITKR